MKIEVWADVVCPWCCIGQVRLTKALAGLPRRADVQVVHRAFQLDPGAEGLRPVREVLAARYGLDAARLEATGARVREIAASEGLTPFVTLDNRSGNTRLAHQILTWAGDRGHGARAWDAVYRAYFCEGRDIFTREGLLAPGEEAQRRTLRGVVPRERLTDARRSAGEEDAHPSRLTTSAAPRAPSRPARRSPRARRRARRAVAPTRW